MLSSFYVLDVKSFREKLQVCVFCCNNLTLKNDMRMCKLWNDVF
jgi:hypothetical protein